MIDKSPEQTVPSTETQPANPQSRNSSKDTVVALAFLAIILGAPVSAFFFAYDLIVFLTTTPLGLLYLFTLVLVIAYGLVLTGSALYNKRLRSEFPRKYRLHNKRLTRVPRFFAGWFLPCISIFLILAGEVVFIQTVPKSESGSVLYDFIITLSRAIILIMVGMELQYTAQEHWTESRWQVLITVSLVLDFVSFFLLTAAYASMGASTAINNVDVTPSVYALLFALLLGLASLVSSYYTVTQARHADEALANDGPSKRKL